MSSGDLATEAFHEAWRQMAERFPGGRWEREGDVVTIVTGLPVAPFNGVWTTAPGVGGSALLERVDELAAGDLPYNLQIRGSAAPALADALVSRSLTPTAEIPLMVSSPSELVTRSVPLELSDVVTYDELGTHLGLLETVFGMPSEVTRRAFPVALFSMPGVRTALGAAGGATVTTGVSVEVGTSVGVFNIATPEDQRGKGYGGAVTAELVRAAFDRDATTAWLQASPLGEPVYRGIGFTTAETWQQWIPTRFLG